MAPSNIAHPDRAYNNFHKKKRFIQGTKYKTEELVKGKRTMHTIVPNVLVQNVGHKPNYLHTAGSVMKEGTGRVGYVRMRPAKATYVKPYQRKFVPRGKDKKQRERESKSDNLLSSIG
jgi:hypothetical protein